MSELAQKIMLIGIDAPIAKLIYRYAQEGKLPAFAKLIKEGTYAENCLVPYPTITPPNWTTIVTGAWPGTHGITCFNVHVPGDPLDMTHQGFDSNDCQAEYLWDLAEKEGKRSIIFNYPYSFPPTIKKGIQIGGAGLAVNEWRVERGKMLKGFYGSRASICQDQLFSIEEYPLANEIRFSHAESWKGFDLGKKDLEAPLIFSYHHAMKKVSEKKRWWLLLPDDGKGYEKAVIAKTKYGKDIVCTLKVGQWSDLITESFETEEGKKDAVFRIKLLELSNDGKKLKIYFTAICQLDGWSYPEDIAKQIQTKEGLPLPELPHSRLGLEWIDLKTYNEIVDFHNKWFSEAISHLLKKHEWDLFFMHNHTPDWSYHGFVMELDPKTCQDKNRLSEYQEAELEFYQSLDRMLADIIRFADEETLVIVVSDHGITPAHYINVSQLLEQGGYTVYKEGPQISNREIDWSKTRAVAQRSIYIYLNMKGRDPEGIVKPEEYEELQEEVIRFLYDYTDPQTNKKPIAFAFKKKDARLIGLYGDYIGDIVYGANPEFGGEHGMQLPTSDTEIGSQRGLLIITGPGIKKDYILKRTCWLTDIVPTSCYLLDLPVPKDTEGAIIYQALEVPNFKLNQMKKLEKNYERIKKAYRSGTALSHFYNR